MQVDPAKLLSDPAYNEQYMTDFVTNRDDRFYATIFTGGTPYPTPDLPTGTRYWSAWRKAADASAPGGFKYMSLASDQKAVTIGSGVSGFFEIKGLDNTLTSTVTVEQAEPLAAGGGLAHLRSRVTARRDGAGPTDVLDWRFVAALA